MALHLHWYLLQQARLEVGNPHPESRRLEAAQSTEAEMAVLPILALEDQRPEDLQPWWSLEMKAQHIEYDWWADTNAGF